MSFLGLCLSRARLPAASALALALLALVVVSPAHAASLAVTTTADELNADGDCSLREAIQSANTDTAVDLCAAGSGADTISVAAGTYPIGIAGTGENANATGDFDISTNVSIAGAGAATTVVDGSDLDRIFHVSGTAAISGLTIRNGAEPAGGGIFNEGSALVLTDSVVADNEALGSFPSLGGGILNTSPLTLVRTVVSGNTTGNWGGGIYNDDRVTLLDSTVTGNQTTSDSAENRGGGIFNSGLLVVTGSTISDNVGELFGGGIWNAGTGTATLTLTTVSGNTAPGPPSTVGVGGGIFNFGTLTLEEGSVSGNSAGQAGGFANNGTLTVTGSTIDGNAASSSGGGIDHYGGTLTITNSTVSGNSGFGAGGLRTSGGTATVISSTFSGNTGIGFVGFSGGAIKNGSGGVVNLVGTILADSNGNDCVGTLTSQGYNLIENTATCTIEGDATGNLTGIDPLLGPLADNGGPTETHALLEGSPAIDAGSPSCPPPDTDQRGVDRAQGADCDIGAFEAAAASPEAVIAEVAGAVEELVESADPKVSDKAEDARDKLRAALAELGKTPPDGAAALGALEGAAGELEAMVKDGLLTAAEGEELMDALTGAARLVADEAIEAAAGGDPAKLAEAVQARQDGDTLRNGGQFKAAIGKYKEAFAKAVSA